MRKILAITGIRAEYDLMYPVYKAIDDDPKLSLSLIVTGSHVSKNFGHTIDRIREDGFDIAEIVESLIDGDNDVSRLKGAAVQLLGLTQTIDRTRPDFLLVFGDREETLTTAMCAIYLNIPLVHISGGDRVVGNVDDQVRHAVTKLASIHFTTSDASKDRILKMGEQEFRTLFVGNPGIDRIKLTPQLTKHDVLGYFNLTGDDKPLIVVVQHVISTEIEQAYEQMKTTLEAVKVLGYNTVMSYPNSDAGSRDIIRCIEEYKDLPNLRIEKFIPRLQFVNALRHADCLLGNSSLGLLEAPFLKLPAVNVGNRQKMRMQAGNVEFVPHNIEAIIHAVKKAISDQEYKQKIDNLVCPFGDGNAAEKIVEVLKNIPYDKNLLIKDITY